jgi:hypothetical protein
LQTTLSPAQEAIVVALRRTLLLPLDDLLAVTREFVCEDVSRSGLDRCLRRHGVSDLKALMPQEDAPKAAPKTFKDYEPGFVHVDLKYLPQMPDEEAPLPLRRHRPRHPLGLRGGAPREIRRLRPGLPAAPPAGRPVPDHQGAHRQRQGVHRPVLRHRPAPADRQASLRPGLRRPRHRPPSHQAPHPQTNGMVERFNGRISEVLATRRFRSGEHLEDTLLRYVSIYNHHIPQRALGHISPVEALQQWYQKKPDLFVSDVNTP